VTPQLLPVLTGNSGVLNLQVAPSAVRNPDGDAIHFDVVRGAANEVIDQLRSFGVEARGSIVLEPVSTSISAYGERAATGRTRFDDFTPVWAEVDSRIRTDGRFPPSWYLLLIIAGLIAAVGLMTNSQILIVGAMVVGPEYGAIVALAYGVRARDADLVRNSARALAVGFSLAVIGALLLGLLIRAGSLQPRAFAAGIRPVSNLIDSPDWFSVIVAMLAGIVGVISLTEARTGTLIGVFISVTTIPAAADMGVSIAFGDGKQALGSLEQLLLNVFLLAAVAVVGIPAQRALWRRVSGQPRM
jgi:uncharacterized hydrophobic protein (TIGR00271 family)